MLWIICLVYRRTDFGVDPLTDVPDQSFMAAFRQLIIVWPSDFHCPSRLRTLIIEYEYERGEVGWNDMICQGSHNSSEYHKWQHASNLLFKNSGQADPPEFWCLCYLHQDSPWAKWVLVGKICIRRYLQKSALLAIEYCQIRINILVWPQLWPCISPSVFAGSTRGLVRLNARIVKFLMDCTICSSSTVLKIQ